MSLLLDHLWSKILRCATVSGPLLLCIEVVGPAKVSELYNPIGVEQDVLRLDVPMDDGWVETVEVLDSRDALSEVLTRYFVSEAAFFLEQRIDLALSTELQDKIEVVVILVVIVQLQDMVMVQFVHNLHLQLDLFNQIVLKNLLFIDDLDGEHVFAYFMTHFINLSESTNTNISIRK